MRLSKSISILLMAVVAFSCQNDDEQPRIDPASNAAANRWILNVMDEVYYWLNDLGTPIAENSEPEDYFEALLNRPTDRFSVIYPDYQELIDALNGVNLEAGYEFILYRETSEANSNVYASVTYIKKNSPASNVDLKRGDMITKINGTQLTINNYSELLGAIRGMHTLSYARYDEASETYTVMPEITLTAVQLAENPNFLDTVYTIENEKIGYVIYHFFAPGPGENNTSYDAEMDEIFANFKAEGIDHLIVDFRYNGGGYVSSAVNLASLIAPGVSSSSIFSKTKYNDYLMDQFAELRNVQTPFLAKAQNLGNSLIENRVYILTSARTASASELIINGLKPYMDVFLIGDVTTGKNVGSIPFEDEENEQNKYGILPIVSQSFNSLDQSDYTEGFNPNISLKESQERLLPLGDVNELLLRTAISEITGMPSGARYRQLDREDLGSTLDQKVRSGISIENRFMN
jgi:C-terminal processing protease CtpA/Prc